MTTLEAQAKKLTQEFLDLVAREWGKPIAPSIIQSAAFERRYANGYSICGWHGQRSRGFGELNVVLCIWAPGLRRVHDWDEYLHHNDVHTHFTAEHMAAYQAFLLKAKEVVMEACRV